MPVLDEENHLRGAVESVLDQDYPGTIQVCLALGPSCDDTDRIAHELARDDRRVSTVPNPSGGRCTGLNAAIRATTGSVVVRVDAHSIVPPGYITRAVETLVRTGAANVGGVQQAVGDAPFTRAVARALASPFGMGGARFHTGGEEGPVDTVFLGVFRRDALEAVGSFDESLIGNEDFELNFRLRKSGRIVWFDPALRVDYTPRSSFTALARQFFSYGKWKRDVLRKHPSSLRLRQVIPLAVLVAVAASLVVAVWAPAVLIVPGIYIASLVVVSTFTGHGIAERTRLLAIFPTMHLSWALGMLLGGRLGRSPSTR